MAETRDNTGVFFKAREKKSDKSPDWTGTARVNGHDYQVSGWTKQGAKAGTFFSLAFSEPKPKDRDGIPF